MSLPYASTNAEGSWVDELVDNYLNSDVLDGELGSGLDPEPYHLQETAIRTETVTQQSMPMPEPVVSNGREEHSGSTSEDSWSDAIDLDLNDDGGFDWDISDDVPVIHLSESTMPVSVSNSIVSPETASIDRGGLPVFTSQDEIAERASLTSPEVENILSDLHGITRGVANLGMDENHASKSTSQPTILSILEDELSKLPAERNSAYRQAVMKCPGLVSDERKMAFLDREEGDPALAAVRLAFHWELRLKIFGPERCFLPMTLNGAMKGEAENMVRWPIHHLLPMKDMSGRAIWYGEPSFRDYNNYSPEKELMQLWYILEVATEDPEVLKHGLVLVANLKDVEMKNYYQNDKLFAAPSKEMALILEWALPIRLRALHFCQPSTVVYFVLPIVLRMYGRYFRRRFLMHRDSEAKVLQELEGFCLPKKRLPTPLGGEVVLDMAKFLSHRMTVESSRPDPRLVLDERPILVSKGPATKRSRSHKNAAVEAKASMGSTTRGKPDPRMTLAVDIRLDNLDMPLEDVLLKAGYTFDFKNKKGEAIDADNVSLTQRKNNLCRRVRQEKAKQLEQAGSPTEAKHDNGQDNTKMNTVPDASFSDVGARQNASIVSVKGKPDPRMTLAVDIRLENLDMPLLDVLLKAGYTFDFTDEDGELVGADRISLTQRKNNLCRRVRQEKLKRAAVGASSVEAQQQDNEHEIVNGMSTVPSAALSADPVIGGI